MPKKCIICNKKATYRVKDTPDFYCEECAEENFAELSMLVNVEEEAQRLKEFIKQRTDSSFIEDEEEPKHKRKNNQDGLQDN